MTIGLAALIDLLANGIVATSPTSATLTVHLAERDGQTVAAAVLDTGRELRISEEWVAGVATPSFAG